MPQISRRTARQLRETLKGMLSSLSQGDPQNPDPEEVEEEEEEQETEPTEPTETRAQPPQPVAQASFKYALGQKVRDKITGYKGVIIARVEWLYGCYRYVLQASGTDVFATGPKASHTTDEGALEPLPERGLTPQLQPAPGGPETRVQARAMLARAMTDRGA